MFEPGLMQSKTTRAFRTISEAGDELGLQPHVLRFWESKFPQIKPVKRGGGRRFYRPDDIEFLRGIKTLLHDEKHPIKDVQKLIRVKGAARIAELGRSVEKASRDRAIEDTVLIPERLATAESQIRPAAMPKPSRPPEPTSAPVVPAPVIPAAVAPALVVQTPVAAPTTPEPVSSAEPQKKRDDLLDAINQLEQLKSKWDDFKQAPTSKA